MATTIIRTTTIGLTKESERQLQKTMEELGENQNQTIKKAIDNLYTKVFETNSKG